MDIERLVECVDLSRTLSFTETAANLHMSQPALSKHIKQLEDSIGMHIFERDRRNVTLCENARTFVSDAEEVVEAYQRMLARLQNGREAPRDELRVGYMLGVAGHAIPAIARVFAQAYPDIDVVFKAYEFDQALGALSQKEVDVAIAGYIDNLPHGMAEQRIYEDPYMVAMSRSHPLASAATLTRRDLEKHSVLLPSPHFHAIDRERLINYLSKTDVSVNVREVIHDMNAAPFALSGGTEVTLLPRHLERFFRRQKGNDLVFVPLDDDTPIMHVSAIWRSGEQDEVISAFACISRDALSE